MNTSVNVTWDQNMKFVAKLGNGEIVMDASEEVGGKNEGFRPKPLLMVALAGCTGMDVISIVGKMKQEVTYFNLHVDGVVSDEHPKKYQSMKVVYEFRGVNLEYDKLEKAVNLSIDKYCGVNANLRDAMKMEYEIKILD